MKHVKINWGHCKPLNCNEFLMKILRNTYGLVPLFDIYNIDIHICQTIYKHAFWTLKRQFTFDYFSYCDGHFMDNRFSNESFDSEMSILQYDCYKLCIIIVQCSILLINLKYYDMIWYAEKYDPRGLERIIGLWYLR